MLHLSGSMEFADASEVPLTNVKQPCPPVPCVQQQAQNAVWQLIVCRLAEQRHRRELRYQHARK
jgi:hypothetical protein